MSSRRPPKDWSLSDAPSQTGRTAIVTGANSGIGREIARSLAGLGARVVLACRNPDAADQACTDIVDTVPDADIAIVRLDLSDLSSVRAAADELGALCPRIDLLVENAGVMRGIRELTVDGFELDFGTNFLGHFALTGLLFPRVLAAEAGRVVTVGSAAHRHGVIDFDDLTMARDFNTAAAYSRSKLAQLIFAAELQRRLDAAGLDAPMSVAAHPGASETGVMRDSHLLGWLLGTPSLRALRRLIVMEPAGGALPVVRAATDPDAVGGGYFGPGRPMHLTGAPVPAVWSHKVNDVALGARLWHTAEELTGVRFDVG